uniref:Uncharacterized protein n=1 Tax=Kalanchoe fedtschenkoi TaxID=63787 RepID=A0A7N0V1G4_KALFE
MSTDLLAGRSEVSKPWRLVATVYPCPVVEASSIGLVSGAFGSRLPMGRCRWFETALVAERGGVCRSHQVTAFSVGVSRGSTAHLVDRQNRHRSGQISAPPTPESLPHACRSALSLCPHLACRSSACVRLSLLCPVRVSSLRAPNLVLRQVCCLGKFGAVCRSGQCLSRALGPFW